MKKFLSAILTLLSMAMLCAASPALTLYEGNIDDVELYAPDGSSLSVLSDIDESGFIIRSKGDGQEVFTSPFGKLYLKGDTILAITGTQDINKVGHLHSQVIDRSVCRWTEVKDKEFYYIVTCADTERASTDTTIACFRGYADCVEGAVEKGVIYGTGVYQTGEIRNTKVMREAYELGRYV